MEFAFDLTPCLEEGDALAELTELTLSCRVLGGATAKVAPGAGHPGHSGHRGGDRGHAGSITPDGGRLPSCRSNHCPPGIKSSCSVPPIQTTTCHIIVKNKNVKVKSRNSATCSNSKAPRKPHHNLRSTTLCPLYSGRHFHSPVSEQESRPDGAAPNESSRTCSFTLVIRD